MAADSPVLALSGGVGGAKLALGLYRILPPDALTVVAIPATDFEHLGLSISPDPRPPTCSIRCQANRMPSSAGGVRVKTWSFMGALEKLWRRHLVSVLGDSDLATI